MFSVNQAQGRIADSETARVLALRSLQILDTDAERVFDELVRAAAAACDAPIALVSLVDQDRQWFKARVGLDLTESARDVSLCSHAIEAQSDLFIVRDMRADARFSKNPIVTQAPFARFYAGVPLVVDGFRIGTLCVIDTKPRKLTARQIATIVALASSVSMAIHYRQRALSLAGDVAIAENRLRHLLSYETETLRRAYVDYVTGLPNRQALGTFIDGQDVSRDLTGSVLLVVHVDRFRAVNDSYGRDLGDAMLRAVGERLQAVATDAYVARLENATFALFVFAPGDASALADRLHDAFRAPFTIDARRITPTISIGIASVASGDVADEISHRADTALQSAKAGGGNRTVMFDEDLAMRSTRRLGLDQDIQSAIERDELFLAYQPIIGRAGNVIAAEALLRWKHPVHGMVSPDEFIPIAEANGTIVAIGRWVIRTACAYLKQFRFSCGLPLRVAVNVSARQFFDAELPAIIADSLAICSLDANALEVEITESTIVSDPVQATALLAELRETGITVSIDDFGTGYSSLAALRRLPIDTLKIDRSFVTTTPSDSDACAIVEAILMLARQLSLLVIAEGVETFEQATYLRQHDCAMMQGYYFARPLAADDFVRFVKDRVALTS